MFLVSCGAEDEQEWDGGEEPTPIVEAIEIEYGSLPMVQRLTGEMRARNQVDVYPEASARIVDVQFESGDRVMEGDTLVRLRDDDVREQLAQARYDRQIAEAQLRQSEASLRRLQAQYERTRELTERDLEAQLELETIQADIDEAEASVDLARAQLERSESLIQERQSELDNRVIRAPIDGVIGNRNAEIGMRADTGTRLLQIGDTDDMRVFVSLTETMSRFAETGQRAELLLEQTPDENPVEARVARISPFLNPVTHTTTAELEVVSENSGRLRPGMFVTLDLFFGQVDEAPLVPESALYDHPIEGETGIFVADRESIEMEFDVPEEVAGEAGERDRATSNPIEVRFLPVDVLARERGMAAVEGLDEPDGWVITVGQNQLAEWESEQAHMRLVDLEHVMELQELQARDLEAIIFGEREEE